MTLGSWLLVAAGIIALIAGWVAASPRPRPNPTVLLAAAVVLVVIGVLIVAGPATVRWR